MTTKNLKWNEYFVSTEDEVPVDFTITISGQYIADKGERVNHERIVHILYDDRYNMSGALYVETLRCLYLINLSKKVVKKERNNV